MADLRLGVANYPGLGQHFTIQAEGAREHRRRNHLKFQVGGFQVDWYQTPEFHDLPRNKRSDLRGAFVPTSDVWVRSVRPHQVDRARRAVDDIVWLLRFASMSAVTPFESEYGASRSEWAVVAEFQDFRAPLDLNDGKVIEAFVHSAWPAFRRLKGRRQLPRVIDYLVFAEHDGLPVEAKLLLLYTAIEHLKTTWAHQAGVPFINGAFRLRDHAGNATKKSPKLGFEQLVGDMLAGVGLSTALKRVARVRNRLVHEGVASHNPRASRGLYRGLLLITHRYLLRLLGVRGMVNDSRTLRPRRI